MPTRSNLLTVQAPYGIRCSPTFVMERARSVAAQSLRSPRSLSLALGHRRDERGLQRHLRRADESVSLRGSERMMQIALKDNGRPVPVSRDERRAARAASTGCESIESVVAEDGWNLTTTDGDIPEDVVGVVHLAERAEPLGHAGAHGTLADPVGRAGGQGAGAGGRARLRFWQRYYAGDPAVVGRTIQLVRKNYQIVGVMPPRFRWREADLYLPLKVTFEPNIYYGVNAQAPAGRLGGGSERRAAADSRAVRESRPPRATRRVPGATCAASSSCTPGRWGRRCTCCSARWPRCC